MTDDERIQIADAVRQACLTAAQQAYEQAGISGLCGEGRWELACDAIRRLDVAAVLDAPAERPDL